MKTPMRDDWYHRGVLAMNVIYGFDLGDHTGWARHCADDDDVLTWGKTDLPATSSGYPYWYRLASFFREISDIIDRPGLVFYEQVRGAVRRKQHAYLYGALEGLLLLRCAQLNIEPRPVNVSSLKLYSTGSGRSTTKALCDVADRFCLEFGHAPAKTEDQKIALCLVRFGLRGPVEVKKK